MNSKQVISKNVCVYQDEAIGASPVPLAIIGKNLKIKKSSDYFMKTGIVIDLQLNEKNEILKIQLGPDICIDLDTMREGVEIGPLGLFPVHILQLHENFNAQEGGALRFGFLKKIFVKQSFTFAMKRLFSKLTGLQFNKSFVEEKDLSTACLNHYGEEIWGNFDIVVKKTASDEWAIYNASLENSEKSLERIVARFNVNRAGVALGIEEMYGE